MPFSMPGKLQKGLSFSPVSPNLGRVTRPMNPISLPSTPQNSTSAPLFRCPEPPFLIPQNTIWGIPFRHLGCPILPFGMSHFTIWGIPFHFLGYIFGTFAHNVQPRCPIWLLRFSLQKHVCFLFSTRKSTRLSYCKNIYTLYGKRKNKFLYLCAIISKQTGKWHCIK